MSARLWSIKASLDPASFLSNAIRAFAMSSRISDGDWDTIVKIVRRDVVRGEPFKMRKCFEWNKVGTNRQNVFTKYHLVQTSTTPSTESVPSTQRQTTLMKMPRNDDLNLIQACLFCIQGESNFESLILIGFFRSVRQKPVDRITNPVCCTE